MFIFPASDLFVWHLVNVAMQKLFLILAHGIKHAGTLANIFK